MMIWNSTIKRITWSRLKPWEKVAAIICYIGVGLFVFHAIKDFFS